MAGNSKETEEGTRTEGRSDGPALPSLWVSCQIHRGETRRRLPVESLRAELGWVSAFPVGPGPVGHFFNYPLTSRGYITLEGFVITSRSPYSPIGFTI